MQNILLLLKGHFTCTCPSQHSEFLQCSYSPLWQDKHRNKTHLESVYSTNTNMTNKAKMTALKLDVIVSVISKITVTLNLDIEKATPRLASR